MHTNSGFLESLKACPHQCVRPKRESDEGTRFELEMVTGRAARGPGRAGPGLPGPRAETGRNGPKDFHLSVALCIVHGQVITRTVVQNCFVLNK